MSDAPGRPGGTPASEEARAVLRLTALPEVGERTVVKLLERFSSGLGALAAPDAAFAEVAGLKAARARHRRAVERTVDDVVDRCRSLGARIVACGEPGYPPRLTDLHDPPPVLFLRGDPGLLEGPAVAVVGSRRATGYGRRMAGRVGAALARAGVVVVSGLALGVDAAGHRGALDAGGRTLAVLGAGVALPHPKTNSGLFEVLVRDHLVVSEFLPDEPPLPHHFPKRNRIMAALAGAVVVVEAAERSGALITAEHALDIGRDVLAVPGPVDRPTSRGANGLLREGAGALISPEAVVEELRWAPGLEVGAVEGTPGSRRPPPALGGDAGAVWDALADEERTPDQVARRTGADPSRVMSTLSVLEMDGWVERRPGMRFRRRQPPGD